MKREIKWHSMKCSKDTNNKNTQEENAVLRLDSRIVVEY